MTTKKVLANVYYFATEILQTAHLKTNWNATSIERAFQWASYCIKVYGECERKPEKEACLNEMLAEIFCASADWNGPCMTVQMLKTATAKLCQSLLQNPHLTEACRMFIIKLYAQGGKMDELKVVCADMILLKAGLTITLEEMKRNPSSSRITPHHLVEMWLKEALPSQTAGSEELFWQRLETLSANYLVILLELLADRPSSLFDQELQDALLQWVLKHLSSSIWLLPSSLLCRVAANHLPFYSVYIQFLIHEVETLQPFYSDTGHRWVARLDSARVLDYADILNHFHDLCTSSEPMKTLTCYVINEESLNLKSSIWLDISNDLQGKDGELQ